VNAALVGFQDNLRRARSWLPLGAGTETAKSALVRFEDGLRFTLPHKAPWGWSHNSRLGVYCVENLDMCRDPDGD